MFLKKKKVKPHQQAHDYTMEKFMLVRCSFRPTVQSARFCPSKWMKGSLAAKMDLQWPSFGADILAAICCSQVAFFSDLYSHTRKASLGIFSPCFLSAIVWVNHACECCGTQLSEVQNKNFWEHLQAFCLTVWFYVTYNGGLCLLQVNTITLCQHTSQSHLFMLLIDLGEARLCAGVFALWNYFKNSPDVLGWQDVCCSIECASWPVE